MSKRDFGGFDVFLVLMMTFFLSVTLYGFVFLLSESFGFDTNPTIRFILGNYLILVLGGFALSSLMYYQFVFMDER